MAHNFSFAPQFSQEAVERYPSLTSALGNYYPGLSAASSFVVKEAPEFYDFAPLLPSPNVHPSLEFAPYNDPYLALPQCLDNLTLATTLPLTSPLLLPPDSPRTPKETTALRRRKFIKTHPCDRCYRIFSTGAELRSHSFFHAGEKRFSCDFPGCFKEFGIKVNLARHMQGMHKFHKDDPPQTATTKVSVAHCEAAPFPVHPDTTPAQFTWDYQESGISADQVQPRPRAVRKRQQVEVVTHPIVGYSLRC
ncbi:hypothetical protein FB45DRAFT_478343 [Roridomyces roridus]|uniref:C2H2-type domain-containing protein n=1 Tax=Roridomyces roridus TaxID=1738132 RepID=A0AAD7BZR8_9AGAR|nr:hypothetical protein FB45DRAFT_478343 [Roridomyces roridus]